MDCRAASMDWPAGHDPYAPGAGYYPPPVNCRWPAPLTMMRTI